MSLLLEGRIGTEGRDGEIREVTAGQVVDIAPGMTSTSVAFVKPSSRSVAAAKLEENP